jgi:hypothetical protein
VRFGQPGDEWGCAAARLAKRLVPEGDGIGNPQSGRSIRPFFQPAMPAAPPVPGTVIPLFDGQTLKNWRMAGRGTFHAIDGALQSVPSFDLGLFWCTIPMSQNFRLELEFFTRLFQTNSEVFIRFKNPELTGYYNPTLSAVFIPGMSAAPAGFQIQIEIPGRRMGPRNVGPEQFMPSITQATPLQILQYRRRPR